MEYYIDHCSQCNDTVLLEDLIPYGVLCERCGRIGNIDDTFWTHRYIESKGIDMSKEVIYLDTPVEVEMSNEYLLREEEIERAVNYNFPARITLRVAQAQLDKCKPLIIEMVFREIEGAHELYMDFGDDWETLKKRLLEEV